MRADWLPRSLRVRATSANNTWIIGQVTRLHPQGFELTAGEMRRSFTYADLDRLERGVVGSRAVAGTVVGGFAGAVYGVMSVVDDASDGAKVACVILWPVCAVAVGTSAAGYTFLGAAAGGGIGYLVKYESWESILPRADMVGLSLIVAPQRVSEGRHRLLIGGRIKF